MISRFSLLEIMVVIIIIATALAVVLPQFGAIPAGIQVRDTINTLNDAMYTASGTALSDGEAARLTIDIEGQVITIERSNSQDSRISKPLEEISDEYPEQTSSYLFDEFQSFQLRYPIELDPDSHFSGEDVSTTFRFYANGEATGPDELVLLVSGRRFSIDVDELTGRPLVTELED
jgi:type II secretory pathway pseudopilin PulG